MKTNNNLMPVTRNYLLLGDKVKMKNGRILTVRSLELREFCCEEEYGYMSKNQIDIILQYKN